MTEPQLLENGWLVQTTTTGDLIATINIYPFRELTIGPLPTLYAGREMWPAVTERVTVNLVEAMRREGSPSKERLRAYLTTPPVSGGCQVFTDRTELKTHLMTILQLFGEQPAMARRKANLWIAAANHAKMPKPKSL
jgi:hypothetical protein